MPGDTPRSKPGGEPETNISRRRVLQGTAAAGVFSLLPTASASAGETVELVVRADDVDVPLLATDGVVDELKATAAESQEPIVDYVEGTDGLAVKNRFWLANALLLEVDTSAVDLDRLVAQEGVSDVHPNFRFELPDPEAAAAAVEDGEVTYGLEQIDAPDAWDAFDSRGEGARVAVLDTGVDPDHPDLDIEPEHFAEFDGDGDEVDAEPYDTHYHGTHVSGTVVGGDDSGTAIGVAPDATLLHGLVLPDGGGTFAQIIGGMQWAVENDADAINMSLGVTGYVGEMIEPVRNAEEAGTIVVSSSGNSGPGTSGSPANVYDSFAVGASDEDETIAEFSSGETISTETAWGHLAPDDWPESYVVPDASAPGVDVTSAFPVDHADGPYEAISGTSMAAPHVAGVVGLVRSAADGEATPDRAKLALTTTAWKPEDEPAEPDSRYGSGIVDAYAAVGRFAADGGVEGTVTDADGDPIAGADVSLDGFPTETDADGGYQLRSVAGTYELTADAFGYASDTVAVDVDDGFTTVDFTLSERLAVALVGDQPEGLQAGESFDVTFDVANVESLTVDRVGGYAGDAWLDVDGEAAEFGEPVTFETARSDEVTVTVHTAEDGVGPLELEYAFAGLGDALTIETGPTGVYEEPVPIAIVDAGSGFAADVEAILAEELPPRYQLSHLEPAAALAAAEDREHEGYVVQHLGDDAELVADFVDEASAPDVGVVYLDQFGEESEAISQVSGVTGDPRDTFDAAVESALPIAYPVEYEVTEAHPAFEGIAEPDEAVTIAEPDVVPVGGMLYVSGFHSYFEGYGGGLAGSTVAETAIGFETTGDGLAIDDLSREVYAASLGLGTFVDRAAVTAAGRQLLGNLVEHAAATPPIEVVGAPAERIAPGESATLDVAVEDLVELEVDVSGLRFLDEADLTLFVDGEAVDAGEPIAFDEFDGTVEIAVETADRIGEFSIATRFVTLGDRGQDVETVATFRPTTVYESPLRVPDQLDDLQAAVDFVGEGDTVEIADGVYEVDEPDRGFQVGLYVETPGITIRGEEGASPSIVHERDLPAPRVLHVAADGVTLENVEANVVDGAVDEKNSIGTGVLVDDFTSDVTIREVTAAGTFGVQLRETTDVVVEDTEVFETVIGVGTDSGFFGTVDGATIRNVTVTDSPDYSFQGGVIVDAATRVSVTDCHIEIEDSDHAGVMLMGPFGEPGRDCRVANNTIVGPDEEPFSDDRINGVYVDAVDVEIEDNHVVDAYTGVRVGEWSFGLDEGDVYVVDNRIENAARGYFQVHDRVSLEFNVIEADVGLQLGEDPDGWYPDQIDADAVLPRYNDLSGAALPFSGVPDDGWGAPEGPFDCRENYLGDRDYDDPIAEGDVVYDPYLTAPPEELESMDAEAVSAGAGDGQSALSLDAGTAGAHSAGPTEIATDLVLEPGGSYAIGVPGPTDQTIYDVLGVDGYGEFAGEIEIWNHDAGNWQSVTGEGELKYVDTLYAFKVTPAEGVRAEVHFQRADDPPVGPDGTPPGHRDSEVDQTHLRERGWNFVPAPAYGDEDDVFDVDVDEIRDELHAPGSQLGTGEKNAFTGYKVSVREDSWLKAGIEAYDPTMVDLYEGVGLDPVIHEEPGPAGSASGLDVTLADVLEADGDEEPSVDRVAAFVTERLAESLDDAADDDLDAALDDVSATAEATVEDAPDDHADLVEEATERAADRAARNVLEAELLEEDPGEAFDSRLERAHADGDGSTTAATALQPAATDD